MTEFAQYKAPRANEEVFCEPPASTWASLASRPLPFSADVRKTITSNEIISIPDVQWSGISLSLLRKWTRLEAIRYSHCNTNSCSDLQSDYLDDAKLWYVSGHQPEFFHPGVWFKNFVLHEAAKQHNAIALNVVIDHDAASPISIEVPSRDDLGNIASRAVALEGWQQMETFQDDPSGNVPWELAIDHGTLNWGKLADETSRLVRPLGIAQPLIQKLIPLIQQFIACGAPVGKAVAAARHQIEQDCGVKNHEVLFSQLAQGRGFSAFVFEILGSLEAFREIYHSSRSDYRSHHRIKNETQPVPRLGEQTRDGHVWMEAPFWIYRKEAPARRPLWIRYTTGQIVLSDLDQWESRVERESGFEAVTNWWQALVRNHVAIRPRALTSTLFMRLAISDLFLHGIGGGKYDQITDLIIERWCGIEPPKFAVATATLFLPIEFAKPTWAGSMKTEPMALATGNGSSTDYQLAPEASAYGSGQIPLSSAQARHQLRDYRFNPERLVSNASSEICQDFCKQLRELIGKIPSGSEKTLWHHSVKSLKSRIRVSLAEELGLTHAYFESQLQASIESDQQQKLQSSREYSIAVFPEGWIQDKLKSLATASVKTISTRPVEATGETIGEAVSSEKN